MLNTVARSCAAVVIAAVAAPAQAALFEAFTGAWAPDISGTLRNVTTFDLKRDLGLDADPQREYVVYFRPEKRWYWPDLSAGFDHLGAQGNGIATGGVRIFDQLTIPTNSALYSTISINDYDVSADIPFNLYGVHFGAGLTVKYLVGDVLVKTLTTGNVAGVGVDPTANTSDTRVNQVFPLVHLRAETNLASWLSLVGSGRYVEYEGNRAYEFRGQVDARPLGPITLSAGYQRKSYLVQSGNYRLNTDIDGVFFGVGLLIK